MEPACAVLPPPAHVHCKCLADHLANRQSEPHMHAIVIAPTVGSSSSQSKTLAFVPDLGTDLIRFFSYDRHTGQLVAAGSVPCASEDEASLTQVSHESHTHFPTCHTSHFPTCHTPIFPIPLTDTFVGHLSTVDHTVRAILNSTRGPMRPTL